MSIQTGTKIEIAVGVDYVIRPEISLAGVSVDPTPLIAGDFMVDYYPANVVLANIVGGLPMTALVVVAGVNISVLTPSISPWLTLPNGVYILLDAATFAVTTADLGRNGKIRIGSASGAFDDIWIDFDVVRFTDSAFQNLQMGEEQIDAASNELRKFGQGDLAAGSHIDFELQDANGNATTIQPSRRVYKAKTGVIPD